MEKSEQTILDKFWKDKEGNQAIIHPPNPPLVLWILFSLIGQLTNGTLKTLSVLLAFGFLFTWAWLELTQGRSYFRRLLGLSVLIFLISNRLR